MVAVAFVGELRRGSWSDKTGAGLDHRESHARCARPGAERTGGRRSFIPLDTSGYSGFSIRLGPADVETPQALEIRVDPAANNGADLMCIYTGVLRSAAIGQSETAWLRGSLVARLPDAREAMVQHFPRAGLDWLPRRDRRAF